MQLQFAILADSAFVLADGKFAIVGGVRRAYVT